MGLTNVTASGGSGFPLTNDVYLASFAMSNGVLTNVTVYGDGKGLTNITDPYFTAWTNETSVAAGQNADGSNAGAAIGRDADGSGYGAAMGDGADGNDHGVGIGTSANGSDDGVAVGASANGIDYGVAIGKSAIGTNYGTAIGSSATAVSNSVAIGYGVVNTEPNSTMIRGTLNMGGQAVTNANFVSYTNKSTAYIAVDSQTTNITPLVVTGVGFRAKAMVMNTYVYARELSSEGFVDSGGAQGGGNFSARSGMFDNAGLVSRLKLTGGDHNVSWTSWDADGATFTRSTSGTPTTNAVFYRMMFFR